MNIERYSDQLTQQLDKAAATGTPKVREAAAMLASSLEPATRLVLVEALADAAGEISRELAPGSVELRVRGKGVDFVVVAPPSALEHDATAVAEAQAEVASLAGEPASRTTLRIPDELKQRAETAAAAEGLSLNTWLARAAALHLEQGVRSRRGRAAARMTGWAKEAD
ncbi:toxin-antitoxin system HicB family antitoxin [Demequina muriae]|uniref:Toxin-antitoxin system HicB family antitoxin n=1 Tax=Demequina muriae TaxID=3051664 RepID=A0ABT8GEZ2_9MICO|nr:toxin-antitoxin system HicB family antitoxin [Demequina sp. EGI L300058]MDN4480000.1 toxin-antitoxin system HicB family antitoxin [Demequina sp. EGI L300058]